MSPYSLAQQRALALLPKLTASASIFGSILIIVTVLRDRSKRSATYHRILLGMSVIDISSSFWLGLSTWPIPVESQVLWAVGTTQSCTLQGFFTQFGIASSFYNSTLSIYYLLVIVYGWRQEAIARIEPYLHAAPVVWGLSTASAAIPLQLLNNANLWCWIAPLPANCELSMDVECIRGEHANIYRWSFFYGPLWLMILVTTVSCIVIFVKVRKVEEAAHRHRFQNSNETYNREQQGLPSSPPPAIQETRSGLMTGAVRSTDDLCGEEQRNNHRRQETSAMSPAPQSPTSRARRQRQSKRTVEVAHQCFLYAAAMWVTWVPLTIVRLLQTICDPSVCTSTTYFPLLVLAAIMTPLQGLPNFLVYLRPKYKQLRQANPTTPFYRLIKGSLEPEATMSAGGGDG